MSFQQKAVTSMIEPEENNMSSPAISKTRKSTYSQSTLFRYWRIRVMYAMMIGYAGFYLLRQNFSFAIPAIVAEYGYTKIQLGAAVSIGACFYGIGKVFAGYIGDRVSARGLMTFGLLMSACMNFFMGCGSMLTWFIAFWVLNYCFQSFGWPPCARLLNHWYSPKELATKWALWNTSQQIGAGVIMLLSPFLITHFGWRYLFYVPGVICVFLAIFLYNRLRDTPESLGLPSIEAHHGLLYIDPDAHLTTHQLFIKRVLNNKLVWYVSLANFFVYFVRMTMFIWAPTMLQEAKGSTIYAAAYQTAVYDVAGIFGGLLAGHLSDKFFKGYRGRVGVLFMLLLAVCILALWQSPAGKTWFQLPCMLAVGFFITGPQVLVGVAASDFSSKRAAGAATGLTGVFGYIGTACSGVGIASIAEKVGWNAAFATILAAALLGAFFFALVRNHRSKMLD